MNTTSAPPPEEPEYKEWVRIVRDYMKQVDRYEAALKDMASGRHGRRVAMLAKKALGE